MKINSRFCPTLNGPIHLGHLYMTLVNAYEAQKTKGKFILRLDDTQPQWIRKVGTDGVKRLSIEYVQQLSCFVSIDQVIAQSALQWDSTVGYIPDFLSRASYCSEQYPEWVSEPSLIMFPLNPLLTYQKVIWDCAEGVNWLIRGEELVTEFSLYTYFAELLGYPRVKHSYIPRLRSGEQYELSEVSKTEGTFQLEKQLENFSVESILEGLRESCLIDPKKEFSVDNIKQCPMLVPGFIK